MPADSTSREISDTAMRSFNSLQGAGSITEACLNLDILRPIPVPNPGSFALPVMVWIYGGNFLSKILNECLFRLPQVRTDAAL